MNTVDGVSLSGIFSGEAWRSISTGLPSLSSVLSVNLYHIHLAPGLRL
jgi:hypothetical protein